MPEKLLNSPSIVGFEVFSTYCKGIFLFYA